MEFEPSRALTAQRANQQVHVERNTSKFSFPIFLKKRQVREGDITVKGYKMELKQAVTGAANRQQTQHNFFFSQSP
jgi:hypothetical protein